MQENPTQKERRVQFIKKHAEELNNKRILEIGALDSPTFKKSEQKIAYADYLTHAQLQKKYPHKTKIQKVDYLLKSDETYSACITKQFDLVIANHVIEHVPDVISWFEELASITSPNGYVFLAVPDKRYTFDLARQETSLGDLLEAYFYRHKVPTYRSIFAHQYEFVKVTADDIWLDADIQGVIEQKRMSLQEALDRTQQMVGNFHSLHCHVFSSVNFRKMFAELEAANLIGFELRAFQDVQYRGNEFLVLYQKRADRTSNE